MPENSPLPTWRVAIWAGAATMVGAFCIGTVLLPFLFPIAQLVLLFPVAPGVVAGVLGGAFRRISVVAVVWFVGVTAFIAHNWITDPFGYRSFYSVYFLRQQPDGMMYFHTWWHVFYLLAPPISLSAALMTYALMTRWRNDDTTKMPEPSNDGIPHSTAIRSLGDKN